MNVKTQDRRDSEHRFFSLLLIALLLFLTSVIHLCHTCRLHGLSARAPIPVPFIDPCLSTGSSPDENTRTGADGPCIACLFLNAMSQAQTSAFFLVLPVALGFVSFRPPRARFLISGDIASPLRPRAPPRWAPQH